MNYHLKLNDRPFRAIKANLKRIEGRTPSNEFDRIYDRMCRGDTITFTNQTSNETMICEVLAVTKYPDVKSMLKAEGIRNVLSSGLDIEGGIRNYNKLKGYAEGIKRFGIYAIKIKPS